MRVRRLSQDRRLWRLSVGALAALSVTVAVAASGQVVAPDEPEPAYIERVVDFLWTEGRYVWMDSFTVRVYPRHPRVGQNVRIRQRIRRTRDGVGRGEASPLRVELSIRPERGALVKLQADNPGPSAAFEHAFERPGQHTISLVTYYSEEEKYTIATRVQVEKVPPRAE